MNKAALADTVQEYIEPGSTVMIGGHAAYKSLKERGYVRHAINHCEGEYASGVRNEIHNCECRIGLLEWWLKKHRGAKWHLVSYIKSFRFVHDHRNYSLNGRFVVTPAMVLERFGGRRA